MENTDIKEKIIFKKVTDNRTVLDLANMLLLGKTLCLNFTECEISQAQNVVTFLSGVNYATDGQIVSIDKNIFLLGLKENMRDPIVKNFIKNFGK